MLRPRWVPLIRKVVDLVGHCEELLAIVFWHITTF
jgi:hypothetical protein